MKESLVRQRRENDLRAFRCCSIAGVPRFAFAAQGAVNNSADRRGQPARTRLTSCQLVTPCQCGRPPDAARMNVEEKRLRTFREWPTNAAVDPTRLAKAGFYYTGQILEVQCFLCGARISDWNYGDQAMARHRLKSPNCPFVLSPTSTCNVPLVPAAADNSTSAESTARRQSLERPGSVESDLDDSQRLTEPSREYGTFAQRLQSFKSWPISSIVHPEQLALAGFYYLQSKDVVKKLLSGLLYMFIANLPRVVCKV